MEPESTKKPIYDYSQAFKSKISLPKEKCEVCPKPATCSVIKSTGERHQFCLDCYAKYGEIPS